MSEARRIVVGVDGSDASRHALDWAAAEARVRGATLHVVCVYSLPTFATASLDAAYAALGKSAVQEGAQAVLDDALEHVKAAGVSVSSALEIGDAAGVLVELSRHAELVVVGTRGRGGFAERLLGTVSSALPVHAHCPTVVVPLRGAPASTEEGHLPPVEPIRRIVVGVDGSRASQVALSQAICEAVAWDAELTAFSSMPVATGSSLLAWAPGQIDHAAILADLETSLDGAIARALVEIEVPEHFHVRRHGLDGTASALLVEFSTAVDLVVVGSRGRGGFSGLLLGSTSQAVLHHAVCPVMIVPVRILDEGPPPTAVAEGLH